MAFSPMRYLRVNLVLKDSTVKPLSKLNNYDLVDIKK